MSEPKPPSLGQKYRFHRLLGSGGAGSVWEAENLLLGRRVAIKVLHEGLAQDRAMKARFLAEARAAARLAHKNVVDVFDLGEADDGRPYIVMELLFGDTLDDIVARGAVSPGFACELMVQVLLALEAAHAAAIVHRDLKPANVMVVHPRPDRTLVKVLDFGIAHGVFPEGIGFDEPGFVYGTPEYMAPEQAIGAAVDARSDLYAAGVILYELLTGRPPFTGSSPTAVMAEILTKRPVSPRSIVPSVPERLDQLVVAALSKDPDDRPPTSRVMIDAIAPFCHRQSLPSIAPPALSDRPIPLVARSSRGSLPDQPPPPAASAAFPRPSPPEPEAHASRRRLALVTEPSEHPPTLDEIDGGWDGDGGETS